MGQNPKSESGAVAQLSLYSLKHMEVLLGRDRAELKKIASRAGRYYSPFPKSVPPLPFSKEPLQQTKIRLIDNPIEPLKSVQDEIHHKLLKQLALPEHLLGGMPGKTIKHNVMLHLGAKVLVTIDIKSFFPSISAAKIFEIWRSFLNCSPTIARILTKLTTRNGYLPQGAPTSTLLANLVLASFDAPIRAACGAKSIQYSSWVDDLAFSGNDDAREIVGLVIRTLKCSGFSVKHKKIKVMGAASKKVLNNILLNKVPSLERSRLNQLRSGIHKLRTGKVQEEQIESYVKTLKGRIAFVRYINPQKGAALELLLRAALK